MFTDAVNESITLDVLKVIFIQESGMRECGYKRRISVIGMLLEALFSLHAVTLSVVAISRANGPPKQ